MLALSGGSTAVEVVAMVLLGLGLIWAVSLVFFAVGRSEDAERAAAERGAPGETPAPPNPAPRGTLEPRPGRRRDHG